jgi:hypothetical protein
MVAKHSYILFDRDLTPSGWSMSPRISFLLMIVLIKLGFIF